MTPSTSTIDGVELERRLFAVYTREVAQCDESGQSTQHIGDEWMRREIRTICGFDVSDRWIKTFRNKFAIRYFSGRRHGDSSPSQKTSKAATSSSTLLKGKIASLKTNYIKNSLERRILRTSRKEYDMVDSKVNDEIVRRHKNGERLTNPWIRDYAQTIARQLYPDNEHVSEFFDSNWLYRFKRRYNVELKPRNPAPPPPSTTDDRSSSSSNISTTPPQPVINHLPPPYKPTQIDYLTHILHLQQYINYITTTATSSFVSQ